MPDPDDGPVDTSYATAYQRAAARRAQENEHVDEYGLAKPAKSWTERLTDYAYPSEAAQATDRPWYADLNAVKAIPAGFAGHVMDELSPVNTRGEFQANWPVLGELGRGQEEGEYYQKRLQAEEAEEARNQAAEESDAGSGADPGPACSEPEQNYTPAEPAPSQEDEEEPSP